LRQPRSTGYRIQRSDLAAAAILKKDLFDRTATYLSDREWLIPAAVINPLIRKIRIVSDTS
jgi:hypothetical protein